MSRRGNQALAVLFSLGVVTLAAGAGDPPSGSTKLPSVFELPALEEQFRALTARMVRQARRRDWAAAERTAREAAAVVPHSPAPPYNLACLRAAAGRTDAAFAALEAAIGRGFNHVAQMEQDPDLAPLRGDPRWAGVLERARSATPPAPAREAIVLPVSNGIARVTESNTVWDARTMLLIPLFRFTETNAGARAIILEHSYTGEYLRQWWQDGTAAGNWGDFYDNRDNDHSTMNCPSFPQITRIRYSPAAVAAKVNAGLPMQFLHPGIVLGNSSAAVTQGPFWRSLPRLAYVNGRGPGLLYLQYRANKLYVYPEHRDHDPGHNGQGGGHGDLYPANTPYLIICEGSSSADQVFLAALGCTLAAFRPEVKTFLAQTQTLMPTVQMILRLTSRALTNRADYLTGLAHPSAFSGTNINFEGMVTLAHAITRTNTPPLIQLQVLEEDRPVAGRDFFHAADGEALFDTPCAIARIWRSTQQRRRMVVSAQASQDLNGRPLTWHWAVLRGDPAGVTIRPLTPDRSQAELTVTWQGRRPVRPGSPLESNRIDIGAFVHNGSYWSAPGFVTFYTLDNEARTYDADGRIRSVTYTGAAEKGNYVDPMIDLPKSWRDDYHYDADGRLTGWTRQRGEKTEEFTADGHLIVKRGRDGQPTLTRPVRYVARPRGPGQRAVLEQQVVK